MPLYNVRKVADFGVHTFLFLLSARPRSISRLRRLRTMHAFCSASLPCGNRSAPHLTTTSAVPITPHSVQQPRHPVRAPRRVAMCGGRGVLGAPDVGASGRYEVTRLCYHTDVTRPGGGSHARTRMQTRAMIRSSKPASSRKSRALFTLCTDLEIPHVNVQPVMLVWSTGMTLGKTNYFVTLLLRCRLTTPARLGPDVGLVHWVGAGWRRHTDSMRE